MISAELAAPEAPVYLRMLRWVEPVGVAEGRSLQRTESVWLAVVGLSR